MESILTPDNTDLAWAGMSSSPSSTWSLEWLTFRYDIIKYNVFHVASYIQIDIFVD